MDPKQRENRQQATRKFMHSLEELETVLQPAPASAPFPDAATESPIGRSTSDDFSEQPLHHLLDDAVQDIEQFIAEPEA